MKEIELSHAYLIMAHNNIYILNTIIEMLDFDNNDIYIHIDKKSKIDLNKINTNTNFSKVYFINSLDVRWGHFTQVQCEIDLLKAALKNGYDYYHLLSGADLPIKNHEYINRFFCRYNGREFIHFDSKTIKKDFDERVRYYYFFQRYIKCFKSKYINILFAFLNKCAVKVQKILKINRNRNVKVQKGANWFSITHELANYVVQNERWIRKTFKYTANPDELFLQSLIANTKYEDRLYNTSYDNSCDLNQRYVDWNRGHPYIWRNYDFEELMASKCIFARKFDENVDIEIVKKIQHKLEEKW